MRPARVSRDGPTVRLLGPVSIGGPGGLVSVPGARTQRMITALALRADRPVPVPFLVDAVWGARPPRTSRDQVHNGMVRLRRVLAAHAGHVRVARVDDGYRLELDRDDVDAHLFQHALDRSRRLAADGDRAGAAAAARAGLRLWYGSALGGPTDGALAGEAVRLNELRLSAHEELFAHELALGNGAEVVADIAALARRHPLRERLVLHLMTALRRTGRSAEALRVFREHRSRMVDELGVEPDRELRDLQTRILRDGPEPAAGGAAGTAAAGAAAGHSEVAAMLLRLAELTAEVSELARHLGSGRDGTPGARLAIDQPR